MLRVSQALLMSAAVIATAMADDRRPPAKPSLADCSAHGPGFIAVPNSATCVRIGVAAGLSFDAAPGRASGQDRAGVGTQGGVQADVRSATEFGSVRAFVRIRGGQDTGRLPR